MVNPVQSPRWKRAFSIFWIFLRLSVLFFLILWISKLPGDVSVSGFGYTLKMNVPFAIGGLFVLLAVTYFIFGLLRFFLGFGQYMRSRFYRNRKKKADLNFKEGLSSFFSDDLAKAFLSFKTAAKYDPEQQSVYRTFMALSALNSHQKGEAKIIFEELTHAQDLKFLGYFGLYQIEESSKLPLLERAFKDLPVHKWILEKLFMAYRDNLSKENISKAESLVGRLYELRHITKKQRQRMYADVNIMRMKMAKKDHDQTAVKLYAERAYDFDSLYAQSVIAFAPFVDESKKLKMFLKAFEAEPVPQLAEAIQKHLPLDVVTFRAFEERLESTNDPQVIFLLGLLAFHAQLWGRAKQIITLLPKDLHDSRYQMLLYQIEQGENKEYRKKTLSS